MPGGFGTGGFSSGGYGTGGSTRYVVPSLGYYLSLLTSQYQNSPRLIAWLSGCLQIFIDAGMATSAMVNAFDIDAAIGPQLDILGQIVGVSRMVGFTPSLGVSSLLTDTAYRVLLRAKVAQNNWDGKSSSLYDIWTRLFPGGTMAFQDNQNMTVTIFLAGAFNSILKDLIINGYIIPRPQAVQYTYVFAAPPLFGVDFNNAYIAGPDIGRIA